VGDDVYVSGRARVTHGDPLTVSFRSPSSPAWPPTRSVGAPPTTTAPARLGTARQRRRSGASRTGNRKPKNRVKDEAPPLARRRVGSGLSGFGALSVLACGGGVSFRFCCTCGARCRSGSLWGLFVSGTCGVRLRFGFFSVSFRLRGAGVAPSVWRGACRCSARSVPVRRAGAPLRRRGAFTQLGIIAEPGLGRSHSAGRAVLLRTLDGSPRSSRSVVAAERSSVFRATLSSSLIVGAHSPGVVLPGQRASSTGVRLPPARRTGSTPTA